MNKWVKKSLELSAAPGYLDALHKIYPVDISEVRPADTKAEKAIKVAFQHRDKSKLIFTLLALARFPVDDPYIGFIRKDKAALGRNPKTLVRIYGRLKSLGLRGILAGVRKPASSSRKMGPAFAKWLHTLGY